jgi:arabinogalactan oligomer/maltooligosaccharide transport system permease protein
MATVMQSFQSNLEWKMRVSDSPTSVLLRRIRLVLAAVFLALAVIMLITNRQNYLTVIFFAWLTFTAILPSHGLLIGYCALTIYPVSRALTIALRPGGNLLQTTLDIIPPDASLDNFRRLFEQNAFVLWLWNSLTISLSVSFIGVAVSATSAYAFSRFRFPGRAPGLLLLLTTQMLPAGMLLIPIFVIVANVGLQNNILGLVLAYTATAVPFSIWILKGYYDTIPYDLEEAALVDGASRMEAFVRLVLPISTPALMTVFLFNFQSAWSEWQVANIILKSPTVATWPIGLKNLIGQFQTDWGTYAAASLLVSVPVMILFMYSSRYVISGLTLGSVKG